MADTFVFYGEWIDNISTLPLEMQDKILADLVRYGTRRDLQHEGDPIVFSMVNGYKGRIDKNIFAYEQKVAMSQTAGRKKKIDENKVYELAREGKTAQEVADTLGVSKSAIDKSEGWKNRKVDDFVF